MMMMNVNIINIKINSQEEEYCSVDIKGNITEIKTQKY